MIVCFLGFSDEKVDFDDQQMMKNNPYIMAPMQK